MPPYLSPAHYRQLPRSRAALTHEERRLHAHSNLRYVLPSWQIVEPFTNTPEAYAFNLRFTAVVGTMWKIQDLREFGGDAKRGKSTLPVTIGIWPARVTVASICFSTPFLVNQFVVVHEVDG